MLILYRVADGSVVRNTGTNSYLPDGPPLEPEMAQLIEHYGGSVEDYGALRLHDERERARVQAMLRAGSAVVSNGALTIWPRLTLDCPATAAVNTDVTVTATVEDVDGNAETTVTFRVVDAQGDSIDAAVTAGVATAVLQFANAGTYAIQAESGSGRYGIAAATIEVTA